jgi:parvulin-like peptidyl-prolyl isomerase
MSALKVASFSECCRLVLAPAVLAAACFTLACRSTPAPATQTPTVSANTWAVVDGREITREDVDRAYRRTQDPSRTLSSEETLTAKLNLLNDLILQDILLARAAQLKLEVTPSELDTAAENASKNMAPDAFQQELTRRGMSQADMRDGIRRDLLTQKVIDQDVGSKISVSDQDVTDFFSANRAQFNVPEEAYHIAQIVVTPVRDQQINNRTGDDATTPEAAVAKVQMLLERLRAGAIFQDLAMGYSEDPESTPRGGDMGFIPVSRLKQAPPQLRDAVLNKQPGAVSVVSVGGAHSIVLVVAHELAGQRDLSMPGVRDGITSTLRTRKEQLLRAAYLTAVRSDAKVVNYLARRLVESQGKMPSLLPFATGAK